MQRCALAATSRYPLADMRQVFQRYPAPGVLRNLHKLLADAVIDVGGKTPLTSRQFFSRRRALSVCRFCNV